MVSPELAIPIDPSTDGAAPKKQPLISDELFGRLTTQDQDTQDAWTELFQRTFSPLTELAARYCPTREDAEEVAIDGIMIFRNTMAKEPGKLTKPSGYLTTCVINQARDRARQHTRRPTTPASVYEQKSVDEGFDYSAFFDQFAAKQPTVEDTIVAREELAEVLPTINTMNPQRQAAVLLTALEYEYHEIVERTGQAEGSVKSGLSRARKLFKKPLEEQRKPKKTPGRAPQPLDPTLLEEIKKEVLVFSAA